MSNDNTGGLLGNPLPIVLVALLAAGVLINHDELKSSRPNDSERVKFAPAGQQDVEARLWQDPFAAVEKYEERSKPTRQTSEKAQQVIDEIPNAAGQTKVTTVSQKSGADTQPNARTPDHLLDQIQKIRKSGGEVKVVGVSVFGGSYAEAAESRRRTRFAILSALDFHGYSPANPDAIGYFRIKLPGGNENISWPDPGNAGLDFNLIGPAGSTVLLDFVNDLDAAKKDPNKLPYGTTGMDGGGYTKSSGKSKPKPVDVTIPYEWFTTSKSSSDVLLLWLNEDKLATGALEKLRSLIANLTPEPANPQPTLINNAKQDFPNDTPKIFVPSATIPACELAASMAVTKRFSKEKMAESTWDCFKKNSPQLNELTKLPIIRTIGTDDVLAAALLWELWQRGVNRNLYQDTWLAQKWAQLVKHQDPATFRHPHCADGLVLIREWDSEYARALSGNLSEGFSARCKVAGDRSPPVRWFTYLRGLDGMLPDIDKSSANATRKDDSGKSKDLRAQLEDAPPEHAEGRSQYDYLRRLGDEIARLDNNDNRFAKNGVKAIGIVGSDVYDKLLILQALRSRFKDKIFFTTDLDARYLHADQKEWARNLVIASNFDLSLRPALQRSTLPFRDGYQTATYLAGLMALEGKPLDYWIRNMENWLRPQIFEIGRTGAVHLASPAVSDLKTWIRSEYTAASATPTEDAKCDDHWTGCKNIEPKRPPQGLPLQPLITIALMIFLGTLSVALLSQGVQRTLRAIYDALTSPVPAEARVAKFWLIVVAVLAFALFETVALTRQAMDTSFAQGSGEPFIWLEGISVWPTVVLRFVGSVTTIALVIVFMIWIRRQAHFISRRFDLPLPQRWKLARSRWSAVLTGPHVDLASIDPDGKAGLKPTGAGVEIASLWQNYLRVTSWREMSGWILISTAIVFLIGFALVFLFGRPSFPHRGLLVENLYRKLTILNAMFLWFVIFWVGYETRACARFIEILSDVPSAWPKSLLDREEAKSGVSRAHLDDYLDFQLIVLATRRIHWLIYLPFVLLLFLVLAHSNLFDAMDFPLPLVFVTGLALAYAVYTAVLLRRSAEAARAKALEHYDARLLAQARLKDSPSVATANTVVARTHTPISAEQIKLLMERIRSTREGAFVPFTQQPALQALLLPFGGYGGVQLVEYLINL